MPLTLTAEWDGAVSRVRLAVAGAAGSTWATFRVRLAGTTAWTIVRGGEEVPVTAGHAVLYDYEFPVSTDDPLLLSEDLLLGPETLLAGSTAEYQVETDASGTVTVVSATDLTNQAWLKFPAYPFRNRKVVVVGRSGVSRSGRSSLIPVASSVLGVSVGEYMSGRELSVTVRTESWQEYESLDTALSLGSIVLLHGDQPRLGLPNIYGVVTAVESNPVGRVHGRARHTQISLTEVARPHHAYAAVVASFATVLDGYDSFEELRTAYDSYAELLELEGSAADVVVP